jgi:hypothetical protein
LCAATASAGRADGAGGLTESDLVRKAIMDAIFLSIRGSMLVD